MVADALASFDALAEVVGAWPRAHFAAELEVASSADRSQLMRLRWRWRVDEFAADVMADALAQSGLVSPPGELDDVFYLAAPYRRGDPRRNLQRLVMTGRGIGKTTRQKVRALHGLIYGARVVSASICATDTDAVGWCDALRSWCHDPPPLLAMAFPELSAAGHEHHVRIRTRFGEHHLLARAIGGSLRGLNVRGARPDALDLDDIEVEERSMSEASRDATEARVAAKVLPLVPLEGRAETWWVQTPVHHDCVAVRAWQGTDRLRGWDARLVPVIRSWPANVELWEQCRLMFFDVDAHGSRPEAAAAAEAFYLANKAAMDEGAEVIDPVRMGPFQVYRTLWSIGASAFAREYEVKTGRYGGSLLDPERWPRHELRDGMIARAGGTIALKAMTLRAHYDPSDGGDDGALVITAEHAGRFYILLVHARKGDTLSQQIPRLPGLIAPFVAHGLTELSWEPPPGAASEVERTLVEAFRREGVRVNLVRHPSTENKVSRIVSTLEPLGAGALLSLPDDVDRRFIAQAASFDPKRNDNADDWLDALQRCIERSRKKDVPSAASALAALRAIR